MGAQFGTCELRQTPILAFPRGGERNYCFLLRINFQFNHVTFHLSHSQLIQLRPCKPKSTTFPRRVLSPLLFARAHRCSFRTRFRNVPSTHGFDVNFVDALRELLSIFQPIAIARTLSGLLFCKPCAFKSARTALTAPIVSGDRVTPSPIHMSSKTSDGYQTDKPLFQPRN